MQSPEYTRDELFGLFRLGVIDLNFFMDRIIIQEGDGIDDHYVGTSLTQYLNLTALQNLDRIQQNTEVEFVEGASVINVTVNPAITAQWIQTDFTIDSTQQHETDN